MPSSRPPEPIARPGEAQPSRLWSIVDLATRPEFCDIVADRVWQAWDAAAGMSLSEETERLRACLGPALVPSCFVAQDNGLFLGTASLLADDLPIRPHLGPWLASVWVEPGARRRGLASALIEHAAAVAFARDCAVLHLFCRAELIDFYGARGWRPIEHDVGPDRVTIMRRDDPAGRAT